MDAQSDENAAKRRKVRKGTHSCWQCRRRKVKCILQSPDDAVCISCRRQSTKCIRQVDSDDPGSTTNKTERDGRVATTNGQLFGKDSDRSRSDFRGADEIPTPSISLLPSLSPVSTLDDRSTTTWENHEVGRKYVAHGKDDQQSEPSPNLLMTPQLPPTPASNYTSITEPVAYPEITQSLLHTLPCRKDIEILLGKFVGLSAFCNQCNFKSHKVPPKDLLKEQISMANLLQPERHPVLLAKQMLLFVAALQYLSPSEAISGLSEHHHVTMQKLAESAIKLVTANEIFLGTLEGLETIILEALYHTDGGNIRRAWVTMRRAVTAAQLLGLHRPGHYRFKVVSDQSDLDPKLMWSCIVYMERVLSLLLGLPASTCGASFEIHESMDTSAQICDLPTLITRVTVEIIERNLINVSQRALDKTLQIDRELIKMTQGLPSAFWRPLALAGLEVNSTESFWETRRALDHMFYYTLVNQLHLPYMLNPNNVSQGLYSRIACVNASREILTREIAIRTFNPSTSCCRIGDFMALIAGLTLMLAHLVSHGQKDMENPLVHQRLGDRAIVETALECMNSMSELHKDALAAQCATLLEDLLAIESDTAQGHSYHTQSPQATNEDYENDRKVLTIKVPYIGAIRISQHGITSMANLETEQERDFHEGVTIGGIGSIHVKSPEISDQRPDNGTSNATAPQTATPQSLEPPIPQHATQGPQVAPGDFTRHDQMFPDAAASMEDWVFQGLDTAFFDVLMRGSGDQQPDGTNADGWNFGIDL